MERRLAAILAADMVGYSRLMSADEAGTLARQQAHLAEVIEPGIAEYRGRIVKTTGDGLLAEFPSVVDALRCAVNIQLATAEREAGRHEETRIAYRIGINLGDIIGEGDDIFGEGVNIAARLEGLAEPGGICVSRTVFNQVKGKVTSGFENLGEHKVKNIPEPINVYRVQMEPEAAGVVPGEAQRAGTWKWIAAAGFAAVLLAAAGLGLWLEPWHERVEPAAVERMAFPLPDKPSIAVLPFDNMSDDPTQAYFADGMAEDLITDLSKISGLFVVARNTTFSYRGQSPNVRQVAEELGVRYVLEGSVRKAGDQVRVNAQLIDATTGGHLWAERYDGSIENVFELQDKITGKIVSVLAIQLTTGELERIALKGTENTDAYDEFLKGWEQYNRQRPDTMKTAISHFERAAKLDPGYSRAYAALAASYWQIWRRFWHAMLGTVGIHDPRIRAEAFLEKAMRNPSALAYQVSAAISSQQGRHEDAITEGERAVAVDPNDADSYVVLAGALNLSGRPSEALPLMERAMRLNPYYPPSYFYELGLARFGLEQFDEAAVSLERAVALNSDDRWSSRLLLATYGHLGRDADAKKVFPLAAKNWRGSDPLTVRSVAYWYPFKKAADAERLADGLRKAEVPD
jgi:TolB-like protein/class 3 adenylate cyclase/Flp pilus assembly protein TadD